MSRACLKTERKVLSLLHDKKSRLQLTQIHAYFIRHNLHQSNQVLSHFVSICGSSNKMSYASRIFYQTHNPNVFLFNSMIKGFSLCGPFEQCFWFLSLMRKNRIVPDEYTFAPLLKSCSNLHDYKLGRSVHAEVIRYGFERHGSIKIGVIELYASCEIMTDALKVFDQMYHRDIIVWNLIIQGFCRIGDFQMGLSLFSQMSERSTVSWNLMISCLARMGEDSQALDLFHEMCDSGFEPDDATLVTVLPICARLGAIEVGKRIHSYADSGGFLRKVVAVGNSLVDFYCKSGNLEVAWTVFKGMPKNTISWNVMISGLAFNGKGELGVDLFEEMIEQGMKPTDATFVGVLACCAHAGLLDRGRKLLTSMTRDFQLQPTLEHYGCLVDLLGRCGCVSEAHDLITKMPVKPNAALWGALLSACHTHGENELAELAIKHLIELEPLNSGNYVLLSNIYAKEGRWNEAQKVRELMQTNFVMKTPGQSRVRS